MRWCVGLGYVGLPLAVEFATSGFNVTGFDVDGSKVEEINAGRSYILDVKTDDVASNVRAGGLATTDMSCLAEMDVIDICVPTPLRKTKIRIFPTSCRRWTLRRHTQARSADHPRIDHIPDDRRGRAARARRTRTEGRRRLLPRLLTRARRSGNQTHALGRSRRSSVA